MGLYDDVYAVGPEFVCDQGHVVTDFQTKDLGATMGTATIKDGIFSFRDGGFLGSLTQDAPKGRLTRTIWIYAACEACPAFIQAKTANLCPHGVEFEVRISRNRIVKVTRVSETLQQFLSREPKEPWMAGCFGPMPYPEALLMQRQMRESRGAAGHARGVAMSAGVIVKTAYVCPHCGTEFERRKDAEQCAAKPVPEPTLQVGNVVRHLGIDDDTPVMLTEWGVMRDFDGAHVVGWRRSESWFHGGSDIPADHLLEERHLTVVASSPECGACGHALGKEHRSRYCLHDYDEKRPDRNNWRGCKCARWIPGGSR